MWDFRKFMFIINFLKCHRMSYEANELNTLKLIWWMFSLTKGNVIFPNRKCDTNYIRVQLYFHQSRCTVFSKLAIDMLELCLEITTATLTPLFNCVFFWFFYCSIEYSSTVRNWLYNRHITRKTSNLNKMNRY